MDSVLEASAIQAFWSSLVSVVLACPLILVLHNARGSREALLFEGFLFFCWICPAMPVVVGMIQTFDMMGLFPYGLISIVVVHGWMNAPFVALMGARALGNVSPQNRRLACTLGLGSLTRLRVLYIRPLAVSLVGSASLVFFLCMTSFNVVLFLGRDYPWPSLGLGLYGVLFDAYLPDKAALYLCVTLGLAFLKTLTLSWGRRGEESLKGTFAPPRPRPQVRALVGLAFFLWCMPLLLGGVHTDATALFHKDLMRSMTTSVSLALVCASVSTFLAFMLTLCFAKKGSKKLYGVLTFLALPSFLVGGAVYVLFVAFVDVDAWSGGLIILTQILVTLPWGVRALLPRVQFVQKATARLTTVLGLSFSTKAFRVFLPAMGGEISRTFSLCAIFSLGDVASVCLFDASHTTLVALVSKQLETFHLGAAQTLSYVLGGLALVFYLIPQIWRRNRAHM